MLAESQNRAAPPYSAAYYPETSGVFRFDSDWVSIIWSEDVAARPNRDEFRQGRQAASLRALAC